MSPFAQTMLALGLGLGLCLAGGSACRSEDASPEASAAAIGRAALDDMTPYRTVESLTTEVGQRLAGTEAHARAVLWAQAKLKESGFENVHIEDFLITAWIRGAETATVTSPAIQQLAVTALGGSVATIGNGIEAEIALFRSYAELLASPPGSLAGKIAVVTQRMVRAADGGGYGAANPIRRAGRRRRPARRGRVSAALARHRQPSPAAYRRAQLSGRSAAHSRGGAVQCPTPISSSGWPRAGRCGCAWC